MDTKKVKTDIKAKIENLKTNPIYQMSLSSLELFHSNFWAWMFNHIFDDNKRTEFIEIFFGNNVEIRNNETINLIEREKAHTDLSIAIGATVYIIENKFKSYPTINQLLEYKKVKRGEKYFCGDKKIAIKDKKVALLYFQITDKTINKFKNNKDENNKDKNNEPDGIKCVSYVDLIKKLKENKKMLECKDEKYEKSKEIINFYCDYITQVNEIFVDFYPKTQNEEANKKTYDFYAENEDFKELEKIKLRDIFFKIKMNELLEYLKENLDKEFHFEISFSNKNSLITIWQKGDEYKAPPEKPIDERIYPKAQGRKGIQIQGGQLRYFYIVPKGVEIEELRENYLKQNTPLCEIKSEIEKWLTIEPNPMAKNNIFNNTGKVPFNKFDRFIYTYEKVNGSLFSDILEKIQTKYGVNSPTNL